MHKSHKKKKSRDRKQHKHERSNGNSSLLEEGNTSMDENVREEGNDVYDIKTSEVMGRYVVASKKLKPGTIIIQEEPLVVGPCTGSKVLCLGCYYNLEKDIKRQVYKCKECNWPLCSKNCTGLYKNVGHSTEECTILKETNSAKTFDYSNLKSIRIYYNVIVPLRCLLMKKYSPEKYEKLLTMESHNAIRKNIPVIWENNQINVVDRILKEWGLVEYDEQEIHTICGILEVNAFEVGQNGISIRGIYPTAFLLSHNCVPNTTHTDEDLHFRLTIRASVEILVGQEINLSYAYTLQSTLKRREHLLESKFFNCTCQRCSDPTELGTYAGALLCPKCSPGLVLSTNPLDTDAVWCCNNKSTDLTNICPGYTVSANSMYILMERITEEVDSIDGNDVEGFETVLQRYRNVLHPNHYHCLGIKHSLSQLYGKITGYMIQNLSEHLLCRKRDICKDILKVFDILEPGYSRLRGITLYELHAPLMILATREFQAQKLTKNELKKRLKEVVCCLQEASVILNFEPENSLEGVMANAAKEALHKIRDWEQILGKIY